MQTKLIFASSRKLTPLKEMNFILILQRNEKTNKNLNFLPVFDFHIFKILFTEDYRVVLVCTGSSKHNLPVPIGFLFKETTLQAK